MLSGKIEHCVGITYLHPERVVPFSVQDFQRCASSGNASKLFGRLWSKATISGSDMIPGEGDSSYSMIWTIAGVSP